MPTDYIDPSSPYLITLHEPTRSEFRQLAWLRIQEASSLLAKNFPDSALYLAGYAIECALKAAICRTLGIDDFFEPYSSKLHSLKVKDDIVQKFKTHDYQTLLVLSGLRPIFDNALQVDGNLAKVDSAFKRYNWSEQYRYEANQRMGWPEVDDYIINANYFLTWISQYW